MNTEGLHVPQTLMEAVTYFSNLDTAHHFFVTVRWPDGVVCPTCGSTGATYNPKYRRFQCNRNHDRRQFTAKTGTVMEDSPLGLDKWAAAFWLEVNAKNSISSYEVHRALGVTQKSAWFMLHRIRLALKQGSFDAKLGGGDVAVEADETLVGGKAANMHKDKRERKVGHNRGGAHMTSVMGLLERHSARKHSTVRAKVIPNRQKETLHAMVHQHVEPGSHLYTDALKNYRELAAIFQHEFIDHAETYVRGLVHTNGLENFWSLFKRCIKGTHVSVEPFHLEAYVDSEAFRFNNREVKDGDRFVMALGGATGKRLTYKALTGKDAMEGFAASDNEGEDVDLPN